MRDYMVRTMYMMRDKVMRSMFNMMACARTKSAKRREALHAHIIRVRVIKYDTPVTRPDCFKLSVGVHSFHILGYYTINSKNSLKFVVNQVLPRHPANTAICSSTS
jgi:hypothetical protein